MSVERIAELLPLLRSRVEEQAERARAELNTLDVAPLLLSWWRSGEEEQQIDALSYAPSLSHPGLMELYRDSAHAALPAFRERTAIGLKRQKATPEVLEMLQTLAHDEHADVRWWARDSLDAIGTPFS